MEKRDKLLWGGLMIVCVVGSAISLAVLINVMSFEKTCKGCIEQGLCSPTLTLNAFGDLPPTNWTQNASIQIHPLGQADRDRGSEGYN